MEIKPIGNVELSGEIQVQPTQPTEYILIGKNEKGEIASKTLTLAVEDITPPTINIIHSPLSPNTEEKVLFTANAADAGEISKVDIAVNGKVVKICTGTSCIYEGGPYPLGSSNL